MRSGRAACLDPYRQRAIASPGMDKWAWVLITEHGVTRYPGVGPRAAYAAVGVDMDDDNTVGLVPYLLEFHRC